MSRFLVTIILFMCCFGAVAQQHKAEVIPIDYTQPGSGMPFFRLKIIDTLKKTPVASKPETKKKKRQQEEDDTILKGYFAEKDLDNKGNLFIMMFSPSCEHCEAQTALFEKNFDLFKNTKLVLVTNPRFQSYLPDFMKRVHTSQFPQMVVGIDDSDFIKETFLYQSLPQINIYNSKRKLVKTYTGNIPIDSLKEFID